MLRISCGTLTPPYEGISFKDGIDEYVMPTDGHQHYWRDPYGEDKPLHISFSTFFYFKEYTKKISRK